MNTKFFLGLCATSTLALALTACSSDTPEGPENFDGKTCFLRVAIQNVNDGTRVNNNSTNFEDGTDAENNIDDLQFAFFDASGKRIETEVQMEKNFVDATAPDYPNVGKVSEAILQVTLQQGSQLPSYVIVSANPINATNLSQAKQMSDLRNLHRDDYKDASGNFTMNNSVYFGTDAVSGQTNVKISGTPITATQLFTSKADAEAATGNNIVNIYIERMAAKVKLNVEKDADAFTLDGYTLNFNPEAWTVTADAPSMYSIKRFANSEDENAPIPSLNDVKTYLGASWNIWNDPANFRSYWACSPAFYASEFPLVSDNISDRATTGTGAGVAVAPYSLKYYSYNQVKENGKTLTVGEQSVRYALENTMGKDAFGSLNPKAAAPSVLLVGKYSLSKDGAEINANTSFYIWNSHIYFDIAPAEGDKVISTSMIADQNIIATDAKGTMLREANASLVVTHPAKDVRGSNNLGENLVTLQLKETPTDLYYRPIGSGEWKAITTEEDIIAVNKQLADQLQYAKAYTNGVAYFAIPIQHLRATEDNTGSPFSTIDGKTVIDWGKVRIGDFGLVRNHVYNINVKEIKGLGDGVFDPNAPIVTPMDSYSYYIKYRINVLNWRIVPTQEVIL